MLMMCLPAEVVDITSMIPISYSTDAVDRIIWKATSNNGKFSVNSAYSLSISYDLMPNCFGKGIWAFNIPPKLKLFAWIVAQANF